jgi:hypothetical protein
VRGTGVGDLGLVLWHPSYNSCSMWIHNVLAMN